MYNLWQFLHVTSAIAWVGAAVLGLFLSFRLGAMRHNAVAAPASRLMEATAVPLYIVASLATLATGLVMAFGWVGFEPLWIKIGLGGIIISIVMGIAYFKPQVAKIDAAIEERGEADPAVQAMIRRTNFAGVIELAILLLVVWAMVVKP